MAIAKKMTQVTMQIMEALLGSDDLNDAITAAISGVIHFFAFRKIRDLKLSDIQK